MKMTYFFGIRDSAIRAKNHQVRGTVTAVSKCRWYQVNLKPVRRYSGDGSVYPHIIEFRYHADGTEYHGKRWVTWRKLPPAVGADITVYIDPADPERYAVPVDDFSPLIRGGGRLG